MQQIADFYAKARAFCQFLAETAIAESSAEALLVSIMELYAAAVRLPDRRPETDAPASGVPELQIEADKKLVPYYWEVFDPWKESPPVCGSLVDDLKGIARDLTQGIKEYESGKFGNAVFTWKFGLNAHWGNHATDAIRALHALRIKNSPFC
jgi:hypothetical protein